MNTTPSQPDPHPIAPPCTPFAIELQRTEEAPNGDFVPSAVVTIGPTLRASGLLTMLSSDEVKLLVALATFVHPNGHCHATALQLATTIGRSLRSTNQLLRHLLRRRWQGHPLLMRLPRDNGLDAYTPSLWLAACVERPPEARSIAEGHIHRQASREAILAHSRTEYGRPRAEVEREIARLNDWDVPELAETAEDRKQIELRRDLRSAGLSRDEATTVLEHFPPERIRRQLTWLPNRHALNPRRYLLAAIENDYAPPRAARLSGGQQTAPADDTQPGTART